MTVKGRIGPQEEVELEDAALQSRPEFSTLWNAVEDPGRW